MKAYCDKKLNVAQMMGFVSESVKKTLWGKRRKCWLSAFSPFSTIFSKGLSKLVLSDKALNLYHTISAFNVSL